MWTFLFIVFFVFLSQVTKLLCTRSLDSAVLCVMLTSILTNTWWHSVHSGKTNLYSSINMILKVREAQPKIDAVHILLAGENFLLSFTAFLNPSHAIGFFSFSFICCLWWWFDFKTQDNQLTCPIIFCFSCCPWCWFWHWRWNGHRSQCQENSCYVTEHQRHCHGNYDSRSNRVRVSTENRITIRSKILRLPCF